MTSEERILGIRDKRNAVHLVEKGVIEQRDLDDPARPGKRKGEREREGGGEGINKEERKNERKKEEGKRDTKVGREDTFLCWIQNERENTGGKEREAGAVASDREFRDSPRIT